MFMYKDVEVYSGNYVPLYSAPSRWQRIYWRLVCRFLGREFPHGKEYIFYVIDNPFAVGGKSALVNPVLYAKMEAALPGNN